MSETNATPSIFDRLGWLGSELVLGLLIGILSIGTAGASYQSSMADSDQTKYNVQAMQMLTDANSDYLTANQNIIQDYTNYDSFYLNQDKPDLSEYYKANFSEELTAGMGRSQDEPFDEPYYTAMYAEPEQKFTDADALFKKAEDFNTRGDQFQLVVLITAVGLAFAAWASLLDEKKKMRLLFGGLSIITFVIAIIAYLQVPPAPM
jgi:hypothetical protein